MSRAAPLLCLLLACGNVATPDAGVDAGFVPTQTRLLGLNDVTWLLPLQALDAGSPFPPPVELIPFSSFDRLTSPVPRVITELGRLRVVAVRFDLCDRAEPTPCAEEADGSFRLVLQPIFGAPPRVEDVTFHAFYAVPRADVPQVVDELRALAELQNVPRGAALQVNVADVTYRQRLAALVSRYAKSARLDRLTLFGQDSDRAALAWVFRGEERSGVAPLGPITIPSLQVTTQEVLLFGGDSYQLLPVADFPLGFSRVVMESNFRNSSSAEQLESVRSLLAIDNPRLHTANTVQCASCHLATTLLAPRATDAGIDVGLQPEHFSSTLFDVTPLGIPGARFRTLRALGYLNDTPLVSRRVINETINVLEELEVRYPAAR